MPESSCEQKLLKQASASYNQGYDAGYDEAWMKAMQTIPIIEQPLPEMNRAHRAEEEYKRGVYDGGDRIVDSILSELDILPGISIQQIIEAGINQMKPYYFRLLGAPEVAGRLINALEARSPLSVVRLGDGELLTLAQKVVMNEELVRKEGHFLSYSGVDLPDLEARDMLIASIKEADIVGVPKLRLANFQPLAFSVMKAHGIPYRDLQLTLSTINYALYLEGYLKKILASYRVLIVGNSAPEFSKILVNGGIHVTGVVSPVEGMRDISRVMDEISAAGDFDIALVSAGIPAVVIVQRIATVLGKVAIDFGHLADSFVSGDAKL
ncbi:GT-D fold domain-containing protein [Paenibacillus dakarensis]|uniref:GT-D fold domain-containing protein n=1 Tax=Paenibacillus dakarensis TaxID=1527293 RepID=UPI001FDF292E|nr:GT-D fold domain-containing glycosyltransferase [Paenibacillus dakarensis]